MLKPVLICSVIALSGLTAGVAQAADLAPFYAQSEDDQPPQQYTFGTGWYLRGDLTASDDIEPNVLGTLPDKSDKRGWGYGGGGGVGYKFTEYFRGDLTGDYLSTQQTVTTNIFGVTSKANLRRFDGLVNGYFDFGTWGGLTPYIGAGVGVAGLRTDGSNVLYPNGTFAPKLKGKTEYDLAWAAMAGFTYNISANLLLDIGYRYLDLGDYRSPVTGKSTDMNAHEIRAGLRYMIY